jgi:hypothetical protein
MRRERLGRHTKLIVNIIKVNSCEYAQEKNLNVMNGKY